MQDDFRQTLSQANRANGTAALDTIECALASVAEGRAETAAQHLATLGFRFQGEDSFDLAARAYGLAARTSRSHAAHYNLAAIRTGIVACCRRQAFDGVESLLEELRQAKAAAGDRGPNDPSLVQIAWDYELAGEAESAVRCYLLARIARDILGGPALTIDGDTLERKIRNLRSLQMTTLAEEGRHEEAQALHERTRTTLGLGPVRIYDIVSARQAAAAGEGDYRELIGPRRIAEPEIRFLAGPVALTSTCGTLDAPPQYVARFKDCLTFPRSNIVLQGNRLIYDLAAHPDSGVADIKDGKNSDQIMTAVYGAGRALVEEPAEAQTLDAGLMMFGLQSKNYGHWLLEFVPRMLCFNDPACPAGFPICIDDHMPETHRQIVELLDERNRPILPLPARAVRFEELGVAPVPTFFPFDARPGLPVYDAVWPKDVLGGMRRAVLDKLAARGVDVRSTGRRIFLSRKGFTQRQLVNETEIAGALARHGFEVVYPEKLSFVEQIALYHAADVIVGSASSALTNCIFCNDNARVVALIHENRSFNFRGYTSMIESSGAKVLFIRGTTVAGENAHPFHANYTVTPGQVLRGLESVGVGP
ncbi:MULTISPECIES: glycosyltransferase family 61 protein [unclassified Methylobacterium]|uniref:glycosyltransferase family 61 protein n=1 Tax=unclassified Methylobacterium TaxID=2615210 RepID=UPI0011C1E6E8|nr:MULTISPECIES: glycosyltransferase family 61 protein [unclassified Methylobacterium]QEE39064.1 glycosyltransferase family 61 protein [Methylobacterium sp. WL1]TXN56729.1 glycosyltransferase family 61 protein [Methylobacterium sp. WL2]